MDRRLDDIWVAIRTFVESVCGVNFHVHDVIAFWHPGDVNPLAAQLFEIQVRPAGRDSLKRTGVTAALVVVCVLEQVLQAKRLFVSQRGDATVQP